MNRSNEMGWFRKKKKKTFGQVIATPFINTIRLIRSIIRWSIGLAVIVCLLYVSVCVIRFRAMNPKSGGFEVFSKPKTIFFVKDWEPFENKLIPEEPVRDPGWGSSSGVTKSGTNLNQKAAQKTTYSW